MAFKIKYEPYLTEMAQILDSKNESDISEMNLVTEEGTENDKAKQKLAYLVNEMRKELKKDEEQNLVENSLNEQGTNSMVKVSTLKEKEFPSSRQKFFPFFGKKPNEVQVFIPIQTPTTEDFSSEITTFFKDKSLNCILCYNSGQLQRKLPLVVVCPISSRFEPDIDFALNGIEYEAQFVALVLHSGLESSLPRLPTSTKLANRGKYQNIEFIDIAFSIEAKLYKCQMNKSAKKRLETFVTGFYKK